LLQGLRYKPRRIITDGLRSNSATRTPSRCRASPGPVSQ
jgi:hypothetical protein